MTTKKIFLSFLLSCAVVAGSGCAAKAPKPLSSVWPPAPEDPRIVHLETIYGREDIRSSTIIDAILGKETVFDFPKPYGVFADQDRIYVTETNNRYAVILNKKLSTIDFIYGGDFGALHTPIGVAVAGDGTVFISDANLGGVYAFDQKGEYLKTLGKRGMFKKPSGLAIDEKQQRLYVTDAGLDTVHVFSLKGGEHLFSFGKPGAGPGGFHTPTNIAVDRRNGNLAVMDTLNFRVQVFDPQGKFLLAFGELGDSVGQFTRPKGIGVDSEGHIYVVDAAFSNLQIFSPQGQLLGVLGSPGTAPGFFFNLPAGMYIDENDRIYIAEQVNSRVQIFQYLSDAWKKANPQEYEKYLKLQETEEKKQAGSSSKEKEKENK